MPVPTSIADLSTSASSNGPGGGEPPSSLDDYLRATQAILKQVSDAGVTLAGAQTITGQKAFSAEMTGFGMIPSATPGTGAVAQVRARASVQSQTTNSEASLVLAAHDFTSLPSYSNVNLTYNGMTTAGNQDHNPSMPKANTCQLEAINTAGLSINANNAPIAFAAGGVERMRINAGGAVGIGVTPQVDIRLRVAGAAGIGPLYAEGVGGKLIVDFQGTGGTYFDGAATFFRAYDGSTNTFQISPNYGARIISDTSLFGYGAGAGGTVTQTTSKSTAVTLNKPTGQIITHNAALAASATAVFTLNNDKITSTSVVAINPVGSTTAYLVDVLSVDTGLARVRVLNTSGGSLSNAIPLQFAVLAGSTT